jgi:hypothetical protein
MRMRRIILFAIFFLHYPINGMIFEKKNLKKFWKMCVWFSFQHLAETFLVLTRIERYIIINVDMASFNALVILARIK